MKRLVLAALAAATLSGCALLKQFLATAFQQPTFNFKSVGLADLSLAGLTLDTVWGLDNPNSVGLSLASIDYALFVEDQQVVSGQPATGLTIPARGSSELHFPANLKFADLVGVVETFLQKDFATWRAEGGLGLSTPIGVVRVPLSKSGEFEVPKVPQVAFGNPRVTALTLQGATLEFPLQVTNRNSYALPIAGVTGSVAIAGATVGTLSTGDLGAMEGKGTKQLALPLQVNFFSAAGAAVNAIRGGNAQVTFDAKLQSGPQAVPVRVDQLLRFVR